ncbi:hypothetical protein LTR36_003957 [Oleoguttula mirabilis]|uniref:Transcription factor spt8 beta-propeller domain-containing protein n=1 Tax=Oleoguttula mirabilis TaxID=1507867 RepID=A0AAV9JJM2_9PEZI|nr:hypothetical protein LTR36_003957 [Oleoguttula mirabilis]
MADFDDADPTAEDEFENEDEEMEDANEGDQDAEGEQDQDEDQGDEDEDEDNEDNDNDNDNDEDEDEDADQDQPDSPSQRPSQPTAPRRSPTRDSQPNANPSVVLTSPSPRQPHVRSPNAGTVASYIPPTRPEALSAQAYDIVPTMAAPQSTSINAIAATPDMRWVFSGGTDGYVRMYNWVDTANGKVPLTVAQKHPFVDSVMKAGSLLTYWENEDTTALRTPTRGDEGGKWTSPVYSLAVQHQAVWLLSGLDSGGINLQTCRHQAGTRITTLKEHTSAVSVLTLSQDETSVLSGSWDKNILDWDLNTGKVKRSFGGSGSQISAVETRPLSDVPIPEVSEAVPEAVNGTFSSNNADGPRANSVMGNGVHGEDSKGEDEDALGSPDGSLFGETNNDQLSLFGEENGGGGGGNAFGEDDDDAFTRDLANGLRDSEPDAPGEDDDAEMGGMGMGSGGPVQAPEAAMPPPTELPDGQSQPHTNGVSHPPAHSDPTTTGPLTNGLPHTTDEPLTAPPTNEDTATATNSSSAATDLPPQSESTFLSAAIDGSLRLWDRRAPRPIATLAPHGSTPPWCTGACWSPDGNAFYAGRRNNTVDEYSIHHLGSGSGNSPHHGSAPSRQFRFQAGSGPVYAVRAMPNSRHLVCASQDILRIYDLRHSSEERRGRSSVPFTIVPGHRGGVISAVQVDPACRFMLSAAGNRGWEGAGTEVLLGYEIGVQDRAGVWHK